MILNAQAIDGRLAYNTGMKLISYRTSPGRISVGAVNGHSVICLDEVIASLPLDDRALDALALRGMSPAQPSMLRLLFSGAEGMACVQAFADRNNAAHARLSDLHLLAPVPRPGKIVAIGRNYGEHAKETGTATFEKPRIITKMASSVVAPGAVVPIGAATKPDFEVELAVVIGAFAHAVPRARALEVVAGYTVLNDLSARELQFDVSPPQTTFAKSLDGYCPMGPWLVTRDVIADPQALDLSLHLNGTLMQQANTADMIFPVDELIEYITRFVTLEPGDVIATGTPSGVGAFRTPPLWLKAGDRLRLEVSGIGVLEHAIG